jgi:hypothetical protein
MWLRCFAMARSWRVLTYTIPPKPTRTRWHVWQDLRRAGAVLVRDGVAAMPESAQARRWAAALRQRIEAGSGVAMAAKAVFDPAGERRLVELFRADRAREYEEIAESCRGLSAHIQREGEHAAIGFAEVAELQADLEKLQRWLAEARGRDHLRSGLDAAASSALAICQRQLTRFADRAAREDLSAKPKRGRARARAAAR